MMKLTAKEKAFQKGIVQSLKRKKLYEGTDDLLISELLYQNRLLEMAKADVDLRGIQVNVRTKEGEPYLNLNQSISVINQATKQIQSLLTKLHITPQERARKKKNEKEAGFDLDGFLRN